MKKPEARVEVRNIKSPGHVVRVDPAKYEAMKRAILSVLVREETKPLRLYAIGRAQAKSGHA
jgi:hypothetical protein